MKENILILDFGNVIALPATGDWDMTPIFKELINLDELDMKKWEASQKKFDHILSANITTLAEEEEMFFRYYDSILKDCEYPLYHPNIAREIAKNRTYEDDKYTLCQNIQDELEKLQEKYTLLMLTDNWPCVFDYLKRNHIEHYFEKVYVSSIYGCVKKERTFFDYLIQDYHVKAGEAIFIDDNEDNLDAAVEKNLLALQMDRLGTVKKSKYPIIHDLKEETIIESILKEEQA